MSIEDLYDEAIEGLADSQASHQNGDRIGARDYAELTGKTLVDLCLALPHPEPATPAPLGWQIEVKEDSEIHRYIGGWTPTEEQLRLVRKFELRQDEVESITVELELTPPEGWQAAQRHSGFSLGELVDGTVDHPWKDHRFANVQLSKPDFLKAASSESKVKKIKVRDVGSVQYVWKADRPGELEWGPASASIFSLDAPPSRTIQWGLGHDQKDEDTSVGFVFKTIRITVRYA